MKYVMFKDDTYVIIPETMSHSDVKFVGTHVHSAGFASFEIYTTEFGTKETRVICHGESFTLRKGCDKKHDEAIINASFM